MEIVIQIILIATVILIALSGGKNGFVKAFGVFARYIGSYFVANAFYLDVSAQTDRIGFIADMKGQTQSVAALEGKVGFFDTVVSSIKAIAEGTLTAEEKSFLIGNTISVVISFAALFLACFFLLKLITVLISKKVENQKTLKTVNVIAGSLVGIAIGIISAWAVAKCYVTFAVPFISERIPEANLPDITSLPVVNALFKLDGIITILN